MGQAHMIGASLGGMIAQHIVAHDGNQVKKLVLTCTSPGHSLGVPLSGGMNQVMAFTGGMNTADMLRNILAPVIFSLLNKRIPSTKKSGNSSWNNAPVLNLCMPVLAREKFAR